MANDNDKVTIRLLRERCDKLESTLNAYDRMLNTGLADTLRRRNRQLESLLWELVQKQVLPEDEQAQLEIALGKKIIYEY